MDHLRDFEIWMEPARLKPVNAFLPRDQIDVPHSFSFRSRSDLTIAELAWLRRDPTDEGFPHHNLDIFCMVKAYMHSKMANGPPVLVMPQERFLRLATPGPTGTSVRKVRVEGVLRHCLQYEMKANRKKHLNDLADELERLSQHWCRENSYTDAVSQLRALTTGIAPQRAPPGWFEQPGNAPVQAIQRSNNTYFDFLPNLSWRLLVNFKN